MNWLIAFAILTSTLLAAPKAVVFDFGDVMASPDPSHIVRFICSSLQISPAEFRAANEEKREAVKRGLKEEEFWIAFGETRDVFLPENWTLAYQQELKEALHPDREMYALAHKLKEGGICVGMLSNINESLAEKVRAHGLYDPFDPCFLSCEIGAEKPDPKAYALLLEALSLPASEVVFIDDRIENVEAARAIGLDAILFKSPDQIRIELTARELLDN